MESFWRDLRSESLLLEKGTNWIPALKNRSTYISKHVKGFQRNICASKKKSTYLNISGNLSVCVRVDNNKFQFSLNRKAKICKYALYESFEVFLGALKARSWQ